MLELDTGTVCCGNHRELPCPDPGQDPNGSQLLGRRSSEQACKLQLQHCSSCLPLADGHRLPHTREDADLQTHLGSSPTDMSLHRSVERDLAQCWKQAGGVWSKRGPRKDPGQAVPVPTTMPAPASGRPGPRREEEEEVQPPMGEGNTATVCSLRPVDRRSSSYAPFQTLYLKKGSGSPTQVME